MRVLISGGGTGGHVYPALAVVEQLRKAQPDQQAADRETVLPKAEAAQPQSTRQQSAVHAKQQNPERSAHEKRAQEQQSKPEVERQAQEPAKQEADSPLHHPYANAEEVELLWIGAEAGMEQGLVQKAGVRYSGISTGQIRGINPLKAAGNFLRMLKGFNQCRSILRQFRPDVCFVTGGYVCVPVTIACRLMGIPILVYLPDMSPGVAIRTVSIFAQRVAVSFDSVADYFGGIYPKGKAVVTGYPVRETLVKASLDRRNARLQCMRALRKSWSTELRDAHVGDFTNFESTSLPLTLIWGGSQGARSINQATWSQLEEILEVSELIHVVGNRDWPLFLESHWTAVQALPEALRKRYYPVAYLHDEMALALAGADLTISRAGASTLGEFPVARLPSILVPLPYAGVAQSKNADMLVERGGAVMMRDEMLKLALAPTIRDMIEDGELRRVMEQNLVDIAKPDAAGHIAFELIKLGT